MCKILRANEYWLTLLFGRIDRIEVECPYCEKRLEIPTIKKGRPILCSCKRVFVEIENAQLQILHVEEIIYPYSDLIFDSPN